MLSQAMEIMVFDGKTSTSHSIPIPLNHLCKQECDHGTSYFHDIQMHLCDFFLAQSVVRIHLMYKKRHQIGSNPSYVKKKKGI